MFIFICFVSNTKLLTNSRHRDVEAGYTNKLNQTKPKFKKFLNKFRIT